MLIHELAKLSGVSQRTLRYYDEIRLLKPDSVHSNGYRHYSQGNLDLLQQILFYRELGFQLADIKKIVHAEDFDVQQALCKQQKLLERKRDYFEGLLTAVKETLHAMEVGETMTNEQKFEAFKNKMIQDNEQQYGEEIRKQHGEESVMASYGKIKDLTEDQYKAVNQLEKMLFERLKEAMALDDATGEAAYEVAELHKRWLSFYWARYTKDAHLGLAKMYVQDERFTAYYDERIGAGATRFLHDTIENYTTN